MGTLGENRAPKFVRKPQLRQEDDGNRLIFECELSGHPQPEVSWFRQDEKINENDRTVIKTTETQVSTYMVVLELDEVVESDAGLYKIRAKNKFGEVSASINLNFSREYLLFSLPVDKCDISFSFQLSMLHNFRKYKSFCWKVHDHISKRKHCYLDRIASALHFLFGEHHQMFCF